MRLLAILFYFSVVIPVWGATSPANLPTYYSSLNGKSGTTLFSAVHSVSKVGYSTLSYGGLWTAYKTTDVYPAGHAKAGKIWDMYGGCTFTYSSDQCGGYSDECDCYNREHSIPKSWFGGGTSDGTPGVDLFHIFPTDGKVNGMRSAYAFGEVSSSSYSYNGSKLGTAKSITISNTILNTSGSSTQTCSATVFEPIDEYKGDFARAYFGTMIRWSEGDYQTFTTGAGAYMFSNAYTAAKYYGLTAYGVALLMKWHRNDPVSQKEIDRNNACQDTQGNRNPFIDYPCLAEYFWGNKSGETFNLSDVIGSFTDGFSGDGCSCGTDPAITQPSDAIDVGATSVGVPVNKSVTILGVNLTANLNFYITGTNASLFSLGATTMTQAAATSGSSLTITYTPTAGGDHTATLVISGGGLASNHEVAITGTCCSPYNVTLYRNGVPEVVPYCGTYTLPTSSTETDACDGWTFKGWITSSSYNSTTAPSYVTSASSAQTLYAVYGKTEGGGGARTLTKASSIAAGDSVALVCEDASNELSSITTFGVGTAYSGTPAGVYGFKVVAGSSSGSWAFQKDGNYMNWTSGNSLGVNATLSDNTSWTVSISSGNATIKNKADNSRQILWNVGSPRFACYSGKTVGASYYIVQLYKITGGGTTTYKTAPCTTYTITLAGGGTTSHGTFEASASSATAGTIITLDDDPDDGYELSEWTVTKAGGGTVSVTGDQFTMPAANVTVSATFTALPTYTATFINNGASYATRTGYEGQSISTPADPTPCDGYTFVGWSTNTYAVDNTSAPDIDYTDVMPAANRTYYAVFSKTEAGGSTLTDNYAKITSEDDLTSGDSYIIAGYYNSNYYALNTTSGGGGWSGTAAYLGTTTVTSVADVITTTDATIIWQITKSGSYLRFYNADAGKYLYTYTSGGGGGTKYNLGLTTGTTGIDYSYTFSAGEWTIKSRSYSSYYVEQYSGKFQMYTSNGNPISIYKQQMESSTIYYTTSPSCVDPLVGDPLDIVNWTGSTLTINATNFASSGWPYHINGTEYGSSAREEDRTLVIPYSAAADGTLRIELTNSSSTVISRQDYLVPHIYESSATLSGTQNTSIVVVNSGTLTVNANTTLAALYVSPDAQLVVNSGKTLTVGKLVLRTTPWKAAILTNNGTISATQTYYTRIIADKSKFYWFALPLASNTANVTLSDGSSCAVASTTSPYGKAWILRYYDTASRAANGNGTEGVSTNWVNLGASGSTYSNAAIEASKGYELFSNSNYYREYYFPVTLPTSATSVSVTYATGAAGAAHAGWNILCSPYTHTHAITITDPATAIKVSHLQQDGSYVQTQPTSLAPVIPFAYQTSSNGSLHFGTNSLTFSAPRRRLSADEENETEWLQLALYQDEELSDETSLFVHPNRFSAEYEIGIDVAKQSLTASRALLYSSHAYGEMAFAGVSDKDLTDGIALTLYSPAEQALRISLRTNEFLNRLSHVYLIDAATSVQKDLLTEDYPFDAPAGTTDQRLSIRGTFKAQESPTGIDLTETEGEIAIYDALGHLIYRSGKGNTFALPSMPEGVYILRTGNSTRKIVIRP